MEKRYILGLETSCDETSAAVVTGEGKILSNIVSSQIPIHQKFGGVVPEIASRNHVMAVENVVDLAVKQAGIKLADITCVAATTEPGLPGAVMVGRVFGDSLATVLGVPFVPTNHIAGHIASVMVDAEVPDVWLCLVASGGHTSLYRVEQNGKGWLAKVICQTVDDACGEAFDKVAKVLGGTYPGGPWISKAAEGYGGELIRFVASNNLVRGNFSYSGLKTAVLNHVNRAKQLGEDIDVPGLAASFQAEAVGQLVDICVAELRKSGAKFLGVAGGVSANKLLRERMTATCAELGAQVVFPPMELCGDNGAMIALASILEVDIYGA